MLRGKHWLGGALLAIFDRALETDIAAQFYGPWDDPGMVRWDKLGRHRPSRTLPAKGVASVQQFTSARRIIMASNGPRRS